MPGAARSYDAEDSADREMPNERSDFVPAAGL